MFLLCVVYVRVPVLSLPPYVLLSVNIDDDDDDDDD